MIAVETIIAANLQHLRQRVRAACLRANRDPASVRIVAVTKYAELEWVRALIEQGVTDLGESRPQQLMERAGLLNSPIRWHLVGHLQRNKARRVLPLVSLIHSVDTFRLLDAIERLAEELGIRPRVLLEVNTSGEAQKHGFSPDELLNGWRRCVITSRVHIDGLMTMAPRGDDPEQASAAFCDLFVLRERLWESWPELDLPELSMGMSGDFEVAIEEGATIVRIGSALFEGLPA